VDCIDIPCDSCRLLLTTECTLAAISREMRMGIA
jgi:hypothetical protein